MAAHNHRTSLRPAGSATAAPNATHGSQTITSTQSNLHTPSATLRLRGALTPEPEASPRVQWAEDVVDNEGLGKKSSKVCCIYHKPRGVDESGSEDDSSSSESESDGEPDLSKAQKAGGKGRGRQGGHDHGHAHDGEGSGKGKGKARKASPNAYERQRKSNDESAG